MLRSLTDIIGNTTASKVTGLLLSSLQKCRVTNSKYSDVGYYYNNPISFIHMNVNPKYGFSMFISTRNLFRRSSGNRWWLKKQHTRRFEIRKTYLWFLRLCWGISVCYGIFLNAEGIRIPIVGNTSRSFTIHSVDWRFPNLFGLPPVLK